MIDIRKFAVMALMGGALALGTAAFTGPAEAASGEKVFKKCKACHTVKKGGKNKVGPNLHGIVGAKAGAVKGFKYSKAMKKAAGDGLTWSEDNLDAFLKKPKKFMKKTKMTFAGLKKDTHRKAVIEYLKGQ